MEEVIARLFADAFSSNRPLLLAVGLAAAAAAHRASCNTLLAISGWASLVLCAAAAALASCAAVITLVLLQRSAVKR